MNRVFNDKQCAKFYIRKRNNLKNYFTHQNHDYDINTIAKNNFSVHFELNMNNN